MTHERAGVGERRARGGAAAGASACRPSAPSSTTSTSGRAAADGGEQVGDRAVQAVALGVGVGRDRRRQLADAVRQVGQQPRELARRRGRDRPAASSASVVAHELVERLDERPVRALDDRVAGAVEDERAALGRLVGELAHEAALARAGLAADEREPQRRRRPSRGISARSSRELARAAGERERRGEAERTGEPGHGLVRSDHPRPPGRGGRSGSDPVIDRRRASRSVRSGSVPVMASPSSTTERRA